MARTEDRDVVVVGAGPAGSAAAAHLARLGRDVLVLERSPGPRPKICGEYLSPDCIPLLDRLGVVPDLDQIGPRRLRGMRIHTPAGTVVTGNFPGVPERGTEATHATPGLRGWQGGIAIPRPVLDGVLAWNAARSGAEVRWGARVTRTLRGRAGVTGVVTRDPEGEREIRSRLVVGADGRHSVVARDLGLRRPHPWLRRTGFILHCGTAAGDGDYGEVFLGRNTYCILNPIGENQVSIGLVLPARVAARSPSPADLLVREEIRRFPLADRALQSGPVLAPVGGIGPLAFRTRRQAHDGAVLVGDAAGFLDPLTGEGIHTALRGAEIATEVAESALRAGDVSARFLSRYESLRREALAAKNRFCSLLQILIRHPRLIESLAARLASAAPLRRAFMGVVGDVLPPGDLLDPALLLGRPA